MDLRHGDAKQPVATEVPARTVAAITPRGYMRFMIIGKGGVNAAVFIEFCRASLPARIARSFSLSIAAPRIPPRRPRRSLKLWGENCGCLSCLAIRLIASRRVGVEASESTYRRSHGRHWQGRLAAQGPFVDAPTAKRSEKSATTIRIRPNVLMIPQHFMIRARSSPRKLAAIEFLCALSRELASRFRGNDLALV
jgi:hypothetical protein